MSSDFLQKGIAQVQLAVEADNAGRYAEAYKLYFTGLDYFITAVKCKCNLAPPPPQEPQTNPQMRRTRRQKTSSTKKLQST